MFEPTAIFRPFGPEGPRVLLFGKPTGDWNMSAFQPPGNYQNAPGLYARLNQVAARNHIKEIDTPNPSTCNAVICRPNDYTFQVQKEVNSVILNRGIEADGMILSRGRSGALATADCPTIVAFLPACRAVIMAHAGMRSLLNGVVDSVMRAASIIYYRYAHCMQVFITCGIAGHHYERADVAPNLKEKRCIIGNNVDLHKLACLGFLAHGVTAVTSDLVDTYGDWNGHGYLWHSYRRDRTSARNFVLVINP